MGTTYLNDWQQRPTSVVDRHVPFVHLVHGREGHGHYHHRDDRNESSKRHFRRCCGPPLPVFAFSLGALQIVLVSTRLLRRPADSTSEHTRAGLSAMDDLGKMKVKDLQKVHHALS